MADQHIALVWNPSKVEKSVLEKALGQAIGPETDKTPRISWWETTPEDPGQGAAEEAIADGADVVIAAGGDGTVRAVAEHLAASESPAELGIIPLGTGNLLARNLGVPLTNRKQAFARVLSGASKRIDVAWIDATIDGEDLHQAFLVMAGFGIDAHMIAETDDELKGKVGWLAYVESLGRAVDASDVLEFDLTIGDAEPRTTEGHTLMIGNCGTIQGGVNLLPDAEPDDGKLDYLLLSAEGIGQWFDTLRTVVWENGIKRMLGQGDSAQSGETAAHGQTESLVVALPEKRTLQIDGESVGEVESFSVSVQPSAIRVR